MKTKTFIFVTCFLSASAFGKDGKGTMTIHSVNNPLTVRVERIYGFTADKSANIVIPELFQSDDRRIDKELAESKGTITWDKASRAQSRERAALDVRKVLQEVVNCYGSRSYYSTDTSVECYGPSAQAMMKQFQYLDASESFQKGTYRTIHYNWAKAFLGNGGKVVRVRKRNSKELISITFDRTVLESIQIGSVSCAKVGTTASSKSYEMAEQYPYFCTIGLLK